VYLEERVTAYYPRDGAVVALVWEASIDDWRCDEWELDGEFDAETDCRDADEAIVWEHDE
jgi:hypothetical protein